MSHLPAILVLEDGSIFHGVSIGAEGQTVGEVVFNTAMTGYQEIITDPSYAEQIVTLTYPHIGNVGVNPDDEESEKIWVAGLIIRDLSMITSNWRSKQSLPNYLKKQNIVGIADIDTRRLTRILREKGAQNGCILAGKIDENQALKIAKAFPSMKGLDLAKKVSTQKNYQWKKGSIHLEGKQTPPPAEFNVVAYDYGIKTNILRLLVDHGCRVTVVPALTPAKEVLAMNPDGVFFSNGPGDPAACDYAVKAMKEVMAANKPLFGICLGHQLLGLACGAKTVKMKFGHHGANHPVQNLATKKVLISSQNHGFAVDEFSLPDTLRPTYRSLFDGSLQGIEHTQKPAFAFQGHPEASPGPQELNELFVHFIDLMRAHRK